MHKKLIKSFYFAVSGIAYAVRTQRNMKIHTLALMLVLIIGSWLELSGLEWSIVLIMAGIVIICEMLNTAMEALVDLETQDYHPLAKTAKDVAAGAVLIASALSIIIGLLIFGPKVLIKLNIF
ncbi:diacylglycerol kinase family protein [Desulfitibacter alkalitolerans]|uniref:diacylglycerol kinase family protein n=1 Tax=Desulfitibacter alkalitolerans TaxID=264641 RepID=UPI0004856D79|nr:diacylglycerol kinase family protein [Desulfitibacter alkalitolerans]